MINSSNTANDNNPSMLTQQNNILETIMKDSIDSIFFKDTMGIFTYVNNNKAFRHGFDCASNMIGKTDYDFYQRVVAEKAFADECQIMQTRESMVGIIEKIVRQDGKTYWVSVSKYPLIDQSNNVIGTWGISRDITDYILTREALKASEAKIKAIIENISDVIAIVAGNTTVSFVSPNIKKYFGWCVDEIIGTKCLKYIHPEDRNKVRSKLKNLLDQNMSAYNIEMRFMKKNKQYCIIDVTVTNMFDNNYINGLLVNFKDITARKKEEERILYLSYRDALTGLYNRAYYMEEKRRLDTDRQLPISIILGDVNGLKLTNDTFGHDEGDKLLITITDIIKNSCRKEDIIARIGGDEFVILLPKTNDDIARSICSRITSACEKCEITSKKIPYHPSIALGHASKTKTEESLDSVQKQAEDLMYRRKLLENKSMHSTIISTIHATLSNDSFETETHSKRMVNLSKNFGIALGLTDELMADLDLLATLHDIGKIIVDENILQKKGGLSEEEWAEIKKHPVVGYKIAQSSSELSRVAKYILHHHERWDGYGYPHGLSGEEIPLLSRIIFIIDAYDAMVHDRPYRKALSKQEAISELIRNKGKQFDPELTKIFIENILR